MIIRLILGVHDYGIVSLSSSSSTAAVPATTTALPAMAHRRGGVAASLGSTQSEKRENAVGVAIIIASLTVSEELGECLLESKL